jgi:hypothetical protein
MRKRKAIATELENWPLPAVLRRRLNCHPPG